MDTSIYTRLALQLLSHTVNIWIDAPLSQKTMKEISSQDCILSQPYSFQASQCDVSATCWSIYL